MDITSAIKQAGPSQAAPLTARTVLASSPISWSEIEQTSIGRIQLSVTHRADEGCLLTSDVSVVEVDEHEWAIDVVVGPELDDDVAELLCRDLARWSRCQGSHYKDLASFMEAR